MDLSTSKALTLLKTRETVSSEIPLFFTCTSPSTIERLSNILTASGYLRAYDKVVCFDANVKRVFESLEVPVSLS